MSRFFGFYDEVMQKYDADVYNACLSLFDTLPLCVFLDNNILIMNGGIIPSLKSLQDIDEIERMGEP